MLLNFESRWLETEMRMELHVRNYFQLKKIEV